MFKRLFFLILDISGHSEVPHFASKTRLAEAWFFLKDGRRSEESMRIGLGDIELEMMMIIYLYVVGKPPPFGLFRMLKTLSLVFAPSRRIFRRGNEPR